MNKTKKNPYPTLTAMGVESPKQIDKYYMTSVNRVDVLRVVYDRPKDSVLPSSRTYKFPRIQVSEAAKGKEEKEVVFLNTHPTLRAALKELQTILEVKTSKENITAEILSEIELLEEDIAIRGECLKVLVGKIPSVE